METLKPLQAYEHHQLGDPTATSLKVSSNVEHQSPSSSSSSSSFSSSSASSCLYSPTASNSPPSSVTSGSQLKRCYLCETPKMQYSLVSAFSQPVCRGCLNFEGFDRVEHLISIARSLKGEDHSQPSAQQQHQNQNQQPNNQTNNVQTNNNNSSNKPPNQNTIEDTQQQHQASLRDKQQHASLGNHQHHQHQQQPEATRPNSIVINVESSDSNDSNLQDSMSTLESSTSQSPKSESKLQLHHQLMQNGHNHHHQHHHNHGHPQQVVDINNGAPNGSLPKLVDQSTPTTPSTLDSRALATSSGTHHRYQSYPPFPAFAGAVAAAAARAQYPSSSSGKAFASQWPPTGYPGAPLGFSSLMMRQHQGMACEQAALAAALEASGMSLSSLAMGRGYPHAQLSSAPARVQHASAVAPPPPPRPVHQTSLPVHNRQAHHKPHAQQAQAQQLPQQQNQAQPQSHSAQVHSQPHSAPQTPTQTRQQNMSQSHPLTHTQLQAQLQPQPQPPQTSATSSLLAAQRLPNQQQQPPQQSSQQIIQQPQHHHQQQQQQLQLQLHLQQTQPQHQAHQQPQHPVSPPRGHSNQENIFAVAGQYQHQRSPTGGHGGQTSQAANHAGHQASMCQLGSAEDGEKFRSLFCAAPKAHHQTMELVGLGHPSQGQGQASGEKTIKRGSPGTSLVSRPTSHITPMTLASHLQSETTGASAINGAHYEAGGQRATAPSRAVTPPRFSDSSNSTISNSPNNLYIQIGNTPCASPLTDGPQTPQSPTQTNETTATPTAATTGRRVHSPADPKRNPEVPPPMTPEGPPPPSSAPTRGRGGSSRGRGAHSSAASSRTDAHGRASGLNGRLTRRSTNNMYSSGNCNQSLELDMDLRGSGGGWTRGKRGHPYHRNSGHQQGGRKKMRCDQAAEEQKVSKSLQATAKELQVNCNSKAQNNNSSTNSYNPTMSQLLQSTIKCIKCQVLIGDQDFVQCPSNSLHKYCFVCSKDSIEAQRRDWLHTKGEPKVFCPSGERCSLATEPMPWTFMNHEIETIFRESSRMRHMYLNGMNKLHQQHQLPQSQSQSSQYQTNTMDDSRSIHLQSKNQNQDYQQRGGAKGNGEAVDSILATSQANRAHQVQQQQQQVQNSSSLATNNTLSSATTTAAAAAATNAAASLSSSSASTSSSSSKSSTSANLAQSGLANYSKGLGTSNKHDGNNGCHQETQTNRNHDGTGSASKQGGANNQMKQSQLLSKSNGVNVE